jgi:hypothetical protein
MALYLTWLGRRRWHAGSGLRPGRNRDLAQGRSRTRLPARDAVNARLLLQLVHAARPTQIAQFGPDPARRIRLGDADQIGGTARGWHQGINHDL